MASSSTFALDFLRRLLCAHSAGGGSADDRHPHPPAAAAASSPPGTEDPQRSPCIVARLMGLDALPPPPLAPSQRTPPLRRSRSASSAEGSPSPSPWEECDRDTQTPRVVVRASKSVRERPAYLRQESDEFLLLSFSPDDHGSERDDVREELDFLLANNAEQAMAVSATSDAAGINKQRRNGGRCRRLRFAAADDDEDEAESGLEAEAAGRVVLRLRRRRKTTAAAAEECDAHGSSPVSVLEAHDESSTTTTTTTTTSSSWELEELEHAEPSCSATSDEPQTIFEQQNSRRKLHAGLDQLDKPSPGRSSCHVSRCSDRERRNRRVVKKDEVITPEVSGIWMPICRLVEEDLKNMEWSTRNGANVVAEMEYGILEQLMCEMVNGLLWEMSETAQHPLPLRSISKKKMVGHNVQTRRAVGSRMLLNNVRLT